MLHADNRNSSKPEICHVGKRIRPRLEVTRSILACRGRQYPASIRTVPIDPSSGEDWRYGSVFLVLGFLDQAVQ
jgi:hypothetical protein